ncbi:MAG: hypothetical protein K6G07_05060 [Lachnospiraceae bacterium]|nr:hypothetical protein [Lachnospiraceae bacterium]
MKNLIKAVCFLGIALFLFVAAGYVLRPSYDQRKETYAGFYAEPKNSIDVVFIGSSPVYPYYAPAKMWKDCGFTSVLLSSSTQRPENVVYLVKEARKTQDPKLFVFELRMFPDTFEYMDSEEGQYYNRSTVDEMKYSFNRSSLIHNNYSDPQIYDHIDLIRYHSNWKEFRPDALRFWDFESPDPYKGFVFNGNIDVLENTTPVGNIDTAPIPDYRQEQLRELAQYCKQEGITALFILSPYPIDEEKKEQFNTMGQIVEEYGFDFLDLNEHYEEIGIDFNTDFYNIGHVNIHGAMKTTAYLEEYIMQNYSVVSPKEKAIADAWDADADIWQKKCDETMATWQGLYDAMYGGVQE